jgi:hypothetical protein
MSRAGFVVGAPLLVSGRIVPSRRGRLLRVGVKIWLAVHYAQVILFPLALALDARAWRTGSRPDGWRCSAVSYIADTAAGVVTGILVDAAKALENEELGVMPSMPSGPIRSWVGHPYGGALLAG